MAALRGPIMVLGAAGFIGANLLRRLTGARDDAFGVIRGWPSWRLAELSPANILVADLLDPQSLRDITDRTRPRTIFNCAAYGAYSFEDDYPKIYDTNFRALVNLVEYLCHVGFDAFIQAGSSSEYGTRSSAPLEDTGLLPNSHYAVSKAAASQYLGYIGNVRRMPTVVLRLYSIYGPYEDTSRLIPNIVIEGLRGRFPSFVDPNTSRDFTYVDDACDAFISAATSLTPEIYGQIFNIGTGQKTTIKDLAIIAAEIFRIKEASHFGSMPSRHWDLPEWFANPTKASAKLDWRARVPLETGLRLTADWFASLPVGAAARMTKRGRGAQPGP